MRKAFTLVELLVIIAIMGLMVTVGIVNVRSGQGAARVRGAARDIYAVIRHARSTALVTMQPAVITYSCVMRDEEPMAKVEIHSAKVLGAGVGAVRMQTLSGEPLEGGEEEDEPAAETADGKDGKTKEDRGETLEDILFAPISEEIVKGMRLKVVMGDDGPDLADGQGKKSRVSVFSNVDYLIGRFADSRKARKEEADAEKDDAGEAVSVGDSGLQEEVSVAWESNGRTEPHRVWIYPDGSSPENGLLIKIDRFGAVKVLSGDGTGDDG